MQLGCKIFYWTKQRYESSLSHCIIYHFTIQQFLYMILLHVYMILKKYVKQIIITAVQI